MSSPSLSKEFYQIFILIATPVKIRNKTRWQIIQK